MMSTLQGEGIPRSALTEQDVREMHALFQEFYDCTSPELFQRDLDDKNWVVVLRDGPDATIQGFTTLAFYPSAIAGRPVGVVYSGDTILRPSYWGTSTMPRTWIKTVLRVGEDLPKPLYWLLISSGYKTYRLLTGFFKDYHPKLDHPTPPDLQEATHHLAEERFGADYDPNSGIVRFSDGATPLRDGVAELTGENLKDPHTAFFAERNPGHANGDELVCLARVALDNLTAAGRHMCR